MSDFLIWNYAFLGNSASTELGLDQFRKIKTTTDSMETQGKSRYKEMRPTTDTDEKSLRCTCSVSLSDELE